MTLGILSPFISLVWGDSQSKNSHPLSGQVVSPYTCATKASAKNLMGGFMGHHFHTDSSSPVFHPFIFRIFFFCHFKLLNLPPAFNEAIISSWTHLPELSSGKFPGRRPDQDAHLAIFAFLNDRSSDWSVLNP